MSTAQNTQQEVSPILIKLLQGFIFQDDKRYWERLVISQEFIRHYFLPLGLYLHLNVEEGFAFLKSTPGKLDNFEEGAKSDEDEGKDIESAAKEFSDIPTAKMSLIRKMPLPFDVSLLLVLLRESLEQFDIKGSDDYRLILSQNELYDLQKLFYPDKNDELALLKKFDTTINKVVEMGLLKELKKNEGNFEVRRALKAFFDATKLQEMKEKMKLALRSQTLDQ